MTMNKIVDGVIVPLTEAEIAERQAEEAAWLAGKQDRQAVAARAERDRLLTASDWTQVADAPVDQIAWAEYRQALRDVPEQAGFPENAVWPTKPN
jgi:hypothetical protein